MVAKAENQIFLNSLKKGTVHIMNSDGTTRTATPEDLGFIIDCRKEHIWRWAEDIQQMNAADDGPGGFKRYPLLMRLADPLNAATTFAELADIEASLKRLNPHPNCPYEQMDKSALPQGE